MKHIGSWVVYCGNTTSCPFGISIAMADLSAAKNAWRKTFGGE